MSLSIEEADQIYQRAKSELEKLAFSKRATKAQREAAQRKCDDLDLNYIGQAVKRIEQRTAKFQHFIVEMQAVINQFDEDSTLMALRDLKIIVDEAATLLGEHQE